MKNQIPPFVHLTGRPYLVVNFDLGGKVIDLTAHLEALLHHHNPTEVLLLRPLSLGEARLLRRSTHDSEVEAWAQMIVKEEDRVRARKG